MSQAIKGLNFGTSGSNNMLQPKGSVVLMSSSYEGRGYHSLSGETGSKQYTNYGNGILWKATVRRRSVFFFSPNISKPDLNHFFPENVILVKKWDDLINQLEGIHGKSPKASIVPTSIQLIRKSENKNNYRN